MQTINKAFEVLTGIDPNSLEINERTVFDYRKRPDYVSTVGRITISITYQTGTPKDWIYASGFSVDQKHVYLGSYAGKIIKINQLGMPIKVYDISNTPRRIIDTGDYLYILTDTRLYILANGEALVDLVDVWDKEKLIVGDNSFGFLGYKHLRWFNETGKSIGMVATKHPIRAVYTLGKDVVVETRQNRAILSYA